MPPGEAPKGLRYR